MPIIVTCPDCSARLNAPDSAAGKRVRCPKPDCGTLIPVPAPTALEPEYEEVEEPARRPRSKPVRAAVEDDEDRPRRKARRDEDEDDDRPRSKRRRDDEDDDRPRKKRKKKQGMGAGAVVALALGSLLVLGGIGYGVYALVSKKSDSAGGGGTGGSGGSRTAVPAGWVEHRSDTDKFRAYFPKAPQSAPMNLPNAKLPPARSITRHVAGTPADDLFIIVFVAQLPPGSPQADRDAYAEDFLKSFRAGVGREGTATWAGQPAKEIVVTKPATKTRPEAGTVVRQMTVGDTLYGAVLATKTGTPPPDTVNGFFDNFELLR